MFGISLISSVLCVFPLFAAVAAAGVKLYLMSYQFVAALKEL